MTEQQSRIRLEYEAKGREKDNLTKMKASGEMDVLQGREFAVPFGTWLCSLPGKWDQPDAVAGRICCTSFHNASRVLVNGTHRLATESEIRVFMETSKREYAALKAEEDLRDGRKTVVIEAQPASVVNK
jgi:hypothetical protein